MRNKQVRVFLKSPAAWRLVLVGLGLLLNVMWLTCRDAADALQEPEGERHLTNIRQLTFGRQNAEAYFSFDGTKLIFQSTNDWADDSSPGAGSSLDRPPPLGCYQMYVMDLQTGSRRRVSTGTGTTTCGYFFPGDRRVLYSSTHLSGPNCPPKPKSDGRYRWALDDYEIFSVRLDGQEVHRLTVSPGYDAEATVAPDGQRIVFTSVRAGDLDLYVMDMDGRHVRRVTHELGYDGGAVFSSDSKRLVYRASHPQNQTELEHYKALLRQNLVEPGQLEIFVMDADGSNKKQVTKNGASNFAPFFYPDGRRIIFASNQHDRASFQLYLVGDDGTAMEQVTTNGSFNSFPMFSPDGRKLVWVSNRGVKERGEFNVFVADWKP